MINIDNSPFEISELDAIVNSILTIHSNQNNTFNYPFYFGSLIEKESSKVYYFRNQDQQISGLCILDILDTQYGQLIIHCIEESQQKPFIQTLLDKKILNNITLELIQFRPSFSIRDAFIEFGYPEKERVKMVHSRLSDFEKFVLPQAISFQPITAQNTQEAGKISYEAHKKHRKRERYFNYYSIENRDFFSKMLQDPSCNTYLNEASNIMYYQDKRVGLVESIMFEFNEKMIPWIADIVILPKFQGRKFGQVLLEHTLHTFYCMGYTESGLSVTRSNTSAYNLYEKIGYQEKENFVEILCY